MSEILTTQEMLPLQDGQTKIRAMGELHKVETLQDIPLTEGASVEQLESSRHEHKHGHFDDNGDDYDEQERKLKTNSLKRLFRLTTKKMFRDEGSSDGAKSGNTIERANVASGVNTPKELGGTLSKASLKSSLNSYWNSVFKHKKSKKSSNSDIELEINAEGASCSANSENRLSIIESNLQASIRTDAEESVLQDLQSLRISEACPQK